MLYKYSEFILNENFYDDFKSKYFKLFNESDEDIKNQMGTLFKKIDDETDFSKIVKIFDDYLSSNQKTLNNKIDESQGQEAINKLLSDNLKAIYFTLKAVQIKLDDKDFTDIFEKAKDKNFQNLMKMKRDKFSDAVPTYVNDYMIPQIKEMAGVEETEQVQESKLYEEETVQVQGTQNVQVQDTEQENTEQENDKQLTNYKEKSKEWFYYVYGMIWDKLKTINNKLNTNRQISSNIDQLSNLMKNSDNEEAKKHLLKKIVSLSKEDLNKVGELLGINKEELGDF